MPGRSELFTNGTAGLEVERCCVLDFLSCLFDENYEVPGHRSCRVVEGSFKPLPRGSLAALALSPFICVELGDARHLPRRVAGEYTSYKHEVRDGLAPYA